MPPSTKADLIIHPTRLQILQALSEAPHTTQEIARMLPNLATPSLYRHLKSLLAGGVIEVADTRRVRGVDEKIYRLAQPAHLSDDDLSGIGSQGHLTFFNAYVASLISGFTGYIEAAYQAARQAGKSEPNLTADRMGYSELTFYASDDEMDSFAQDLQQALQKVAHADPSAGRRRRKLAIISHPVDQF